MPIKHSIEFLGESGVTLRGWLYLPDSSEKPLPAISMCHGFAAVKEHGLEPFAQAFAQAGFVVLVHDHRNFGASDGEPRNDIDPWAQVMDWRRAVSYLESHPKVDRQRIGIWGTSFSGGHALVLAATDRRVRCVVSQVPTISGFEQSRRRVSPDAAPGFLETLSDDLREQHYGGAPRYQAVVSQTRCNRLPIVPPTLLPSTSKISVQPHGITPLRYAPRLLPVCMNRVFGPSASRRPLY